MYVMGAVCNVQRVLSLSFSGESAWQMGHEHEQSTGFPSYLPGYLAG